MLGNITDLDELETGRRREGLILGAESFGWKAVSALGPFLAGIVVDAVGIEATTTPESVGPEVARNLGIAQGSVMTVLLTLALLAFRRYDLTRVRHREIQQALHSRPPTEVV